MRQFLTGLFWDQRGRVASMRDELRRGGYHPSLPDLFVRKTFRDFDELHGKIEKVIAENDQLFEDLRSFDPTGADRLFDDFNVPTIGQHTTFSELLEDAEFRYTVIRRYGEAEAEFSQLLGRIYNEIGLIELLPVVSFISNAHDYYCAYCSHGVIGAPIEEDHHLLNWPDLYHEIGHFIFDKHKRFLLGDGKMMQLVNSHFDEQISQQPALAVPLNDWRKYWTKHWLMEFSCDLIGTYLTGEAYAWSNFRLSSIIPDDNSRDIFTSHPTHPPNEARMRIIFRMLDQCGDTLSRLTPLQTAWQKHTKLGINIEPASYAQMVPDTLLDALTDCVYEECRHQIGLFSFVEQLNRASSNVPVSQLLNVAWQHLLHSPAGYADWEREKIQHLRSEILDNRA